MTLCNALDTIDCDVMVIISHHNDVIMGGMASQITSLTVVYSAVYSRRRSKKTSKLGVTGLCAGNLPVTGEFPAQRPVFWKMFPFDDVIMYSSLFVGSVCRIRTNTIYILSWRTAYGLTWVFFTTREINTKMPLFVTAVHADCPHGAMAIATNWSFTIHN